MTSHQLARQLLEGPDLEVTTEIRCPTNRLCGDENQEVTVELLGNPLNPTRLMLSSHTECIFEISVLDEEEDHGG